MNRYQGRHSWHGPLEVEITTACARCDEAIELVVDSDLNYRIEKGGSNPLVFESDIDWSEFEDPTIIDGY
jgi:hypothetical protein